MFKKFIEFLARLFKRNKNIEKEENENSNYNNQVSFSDNRTEELTMIDCDFFIVEEIEDEEKDENNFII